MALAVAIVVSGIVTGSVYALVASGLSLVWTTLKVFNYAQGSLVMIGAFVTWSATQDLHIGLLLAILAALPVMSVVAVALNRIVIEPFVKRSGGDVVVMVTTLATLTILEGVAQLIWGVQLHGLPAIGGGKVSIAGTVIEANQAFAIVAGPVLLIALAVWLKITRTGTAVRAVAQNREFAQLCGISPGRVYSTVIVIAVGLATVAGAVLGSIQFLTPTMGEQPLLTAFVVVVFGGLASLTGTVLGAYVIGMLTAVATYVVGIQWSPDIVLGLLVLTLMVRPQGLIGHYEGSR